MKVLFINTVFENGSTGRIVKDLGTAVEQNGGEYRAIYGRGVSKDPHAIKMSTNLDVIFHAFFSRITDRAGFYSKRSTRYLVEYIRKYKPDIIHLHNLHGYYLNIEILFDFLKKEYKGKIIWTLHDCWAFTGHCVHYTWVKCNKWMRGCNHCLEKKQYPVSIFFDSSNKNYVDKKRIFTGINNMTIITVSDWLKYQTEQSFLKDYKVQRIYNGIDKKIFHYTENDIKKKNNWENKKIVLLVSDGWNERKGFDKMLQVASIAPTDWMFVIVGLEKKRILKLPDNVIGIEKTWEQQELIKLYSAADVFFNPSVEETFGLTTVEAISCGTPALVFDSTASPEILQKVGVGEVLKTDASSLDIVNGLKFLMDSKVQIKTDLFSKESFISNYLKCYSYKKEDKKMGKELIFWFDQPPKVGKGCFNYISETWENTVVFAYLHDFNKTRKSVNWDDDDYGKAQLIELGPDAQAKVDNLFQMYPDAIHIADGFKSEMMIYLKKYIMSGKYKFISFSERPGVYGKWWKKMLKRVYIPLSEKRISKKYVDKICAYLPLGRTGVKTALKYGWNRDILYPFMYDPVDYVTDYNIYPVGNRVKMLYVGRFSKYTKGTDILMKAIDLLKSDSKTYTLDMAGGYGDLREKALRWIGTKKNVNFLGLWDSKEVGMKMKKYDICIVPSKFDGWNLLVNEAIRAHIAVIVTDEAVSDELVTESNAGMVVPANSPKSLARAIDYAIANKELIEKWKYNAQKYTTCISSKSVGTYMMNIIRYECLGEGRERPSCPWLKEF